MAIIRRGGKHYLIRSVRIGGRVTSRYLASGERALELDRALKAFSRRPDPYELWEERRARRRAERALARGRAAAVAARERDGDLEARVEAMADGARSLAGDVMRACGHHQHKWSWRRKRGAIVDEQQVRRVMDQFGFSHLPTPSPAELEEAQADVDFANTPAGASRTVDNWESHDARRAPGAPSVVGIMRKLHGSDPAAEVKELLVAKWTDSTVGRELLRREMTAMEAELLGVDPTTIERHIIERTVICWLDMHVADRLAISLEASLNFSPAEKGHLQKSRDRSHRRYLDCLKALALVRARAAPALRLSLALQDGASGSSAAAMVESGSK